MSLVLSEVPISRTKILEMLKNVGKSSIADLDSHYCKGPTFQFPKKFQYPLNMPKYSGKTNPSKFIFEFLDITRCFVDNLGLRVHLFYQSLEGLARIWFNAQPQESTHNFTNLVQEFETYFLAQAKHVPTWMDLSEIKMKSDEDFVAYMGHWQESY